MKKSISNSLPASVDWNIDVYSLLYKEEKVLVVADIPPTSTSMVVAASDTSFGADATSVGDR